MKSSDEELTVGCTELPMAMAGVVTHCAVVDSMAVLAKAVVRLAKPRATMPADKPEESNG